MTPSDAAKRKAEELLLSMKSALTNKFTREEAFFIRDQIAAALHIEPGYIRDSEGVDRLVLGTLPVTKDGCIAMPHQQIFVVENGEVIEGQVLLWNELLPAIPLRGGQSIHQRRLWSNAYSTREAAQQSASEKGGG